MDDKVISQKLYESRIIMVSGYINSDAATNIIFQLLTLSSQSEKEPIQLYITASTGNSLDVLSIYDTMRTLPNEIIGIGIGPSSTYACLLLSSCTKGKRFSLPHGEFELSQPSKTLGGTNLQSDVAIELREVRHETEVLEEILSKNTNQPIEKIRKDLENEIEMNAEEALAYGIIDKIL